MREHLSPNPEKKLIPELTSFVVKSSPDNTPKK
jgi:hypothetical protein